MQEIAKLTQHSKFYKRSFPLTEDSKTSLTESQPSRNEISLKLEYDV